MFSLQTYTVYKTKYSLQDQGGDLAVTYGYCTVHTGAYGVEHTSRGSYARYVRYRTGSSVWYVHYNKQGILEGLPTIVGTPSGTPTGTPSE